MSDSDIRITILENHGDHRGNSFNIPEDSLIYLHRAQNVHIANVKPAAVRGNHYHLKRKELLLVYHDGPWLLCWDTGEQTPIQKKIFEGAGCALIEIAPDVSHAIQNTGNGALVIVVLSDHVYSPEDSDTYTRTLL
ncbi:MAG: WxcM-like domain-containing protein [Phycisphaerae bacterium]|nr:WxcM-like domain-containing protein [Phycisphaerae bacterium]